MKRNVIHTGDAFDALPDLDDNSVHAVVTDPPYGLAFMGRDWDDFEPKEYQEWSERWARKCKRVLKPGGHLLAFSGNRTHHRLFTGVEDAGFEIRDTLTWHYGSGFPKASDVSKTIDKRADVEPESVSDAEGVGFMNDDDDGWNDTQTHIKMGDPTTDAAREWDGWKTGLKPATEFVVMARMPFSGATVDCVLDHGTGALNIDGCRVGEDVDTSRPAGDMGETQDKYGHYEGNQTNGSGTGGRYPANVVFDETAADALDREVGELGESKGVRGINGEQVYGNGDGYLGSMDAEGGQDVGFGDKGGPSRYFYTSKASRSERTENGAIDNDHPTVKPIDLMEWLIKLVTREGQTVLDPFAGSGTTCKAAKALGREFVGIERQDKWADVARVRCGLTPDDPSVVRTDDNQSGLEAYADGGEP